MSRLVGNSHIAKSKPRCSTKSTFTFTSSNRPSETSSAPALPPRPHLQAKHNPKQPTPARRKPPSNPPSRSLALLDQSYALTRDARSVSALPRARRLVAEFQVLEK